MSSDTLLIMAEEESDVTNGIVYIASDSLIIVSYDSNNVIEEFSTEFQVQWWEALDENNDVVVG